MLQIDFFSTRIKFHGHRGQTMDKPWNARVGTWNARLGTWNAHTGTWTGWSNFSLISSNFID